MEVIDRYLWQSKYDYKSFLMSLDMRSKITAYDH